jgi:hypothetical protein
LQVRTKWGIQVALVMIIVWVLNDDQYDWMLQVVYLGMLVSVKIRHCV